jgi:hypothetical protein
MRIVGCLMMLFMQNEFDDGWRGDGRRRDVTQTELYIVERAMLLTARLNGRGSRFTSNVFKLLLAITEHNGEWCVNFFTLTITNQLQCCLMQGKCVKISVHFSPTNLKGLPMRYQQNCPVLRVSVVPFDAIPSCQR